MANNKAHCDLTVKSFAVRHGDTLANVPWPTGLQHNSPLADSATVVVLPNSTAPTNSRVQGNQRLTRLA